MRSTPRNLPIYALAAVALVASSWVAADKDDAEVDEVELLASGQTVCYDFEQPETEVDCADTGQDANFLLGSAPRYKDMGDGRIKDRNTKLQWAKKSDDGGIHDKDNIYTWREAIQVYVHSLNHICQNDETMTCSTIHDCRVTVGGKCGFAGKRDWRLPNVRELFTIANFEIPDVSADPPIPRVSPAFNNNCTEGVTVLEGSCIQDQDLPYTYWTSTSGDALGDAYFVDFETADVGAHGKNIDEEVDNVVLTDDAGVPLFKLDEQGMPVFQFEEERAFAGHVRAVRGRVRDDD